jgi:hypothetical protein
MFTAPLSDQDVHFFSQISGQTVGEVRAVADMHQRKAEMARQSDAFIALPGESQNLPHFLYLAGIRSDAENIQASAEKSVTSYSRVGSGWHFAHVDLSESEYEG